MYKGVTGITHGTISTQIKNKDPFDYVLDSLDQGNLENLDQACQAMLEESLDETLNFFQHINFFDRLERYPINQILSILTVTIISSSEHPVYQSDSLVNLLFSSAQLIPENPLALLIVRNISTVITPQPGMINALFENIKSIGWNSPDDLELVISSLIHLLCKGSDLSEIIPFFLQNIEICANAINALTACIMIDSYSVLLFDDRAFSIPQIPITESVEFVNAFLKTHYNSEKMVRSINWTNWPDMNSVGIIGETCPENLHIIASTGFFQSRLQHSSELSFQEKKTLGMALISSLSSIEDPLIAELASGGLFELLDDLISCESDDIAFNCSMEVLNLVESSSKDLINFLLSIGLGNLADSIEQCCNQEISEIGGKINSLLNQ